LLQKGAKKRKTRDKAQARFLIALLGMAAVMKAVTA
jgi:hypothetical protein